MKKENIILLLIVIIAIALMIYGLYKKEVDDTLETYEKWSDLDADNDISFGDFQANRQAKKDKIQGPSIFY